MLRDTLVWMAAALPAAAGLIAIAAVVFSDLGFGHTALARSMLVFFVVQTCVPIVLWVGAERLFGGLRTGWVLPALLFPLVVALVGTVGVAASGDWVWPDDPAITAVSIGAWLGFSWTLLASRAVAERLVSLRRES